MLLSPPTSLEDLEPTIVELKKKQKAYIEAGEAELKKETSELEMRIEHEVEQDLEHERQAAQAEYEEDDGYYEEEDKRPFDDAGDAGASKSHGRQGARGRGRRFGEDEPRKRKAPRGEFEGSDDDEEETYETAAASNNPYSKPSRGGGQQVNQGKRGGAKHGGKNRMEIIDDDNFPAL